MRNQKCIRKTLNAWPSHKMELYDGWILRFSYFYTHRTNSVEQFGTSSLPWREKIPYCENVYKRLGTPAIFKISPLVSPDFDYTLENRGYEIQHTTDVMTLCLRAVSYTHLGILYVSGCTVPPSPVIVTAIPRKFPHTATVRNKRTPFLSVSYTHLCP